MASELPAELVGVAQHFGTGFAPVMDFSGWRVAVSRRNPAVTPADFSRVQRHNATNEVFILTQGAAQMVVMAGDTPPTQPHVFQLEPNVVYNVQQGVWHAGFLSDDAHIIIFERADTGADNSDTYELDAATIASILDQITVGK
ncbi:MAG: ureidoglycolate lyase [Litorilinea sp.]